MRLDILILALPALVAAAPTHKHAKRGVDPIVDGFEIRGNTYDYIIAGGGLGGIVLAARLTEDTSKTVLVIEAGYNEMNNPNVTDPGRYQDAFKTFLNWDYPTVPQTSANGQPQYIKAGRALGGSTAINGMAWSKPHSFQLDALESVGNEGVNWNTLQPYMKRAEAFKEPSSEEFAAGITYDINCHGTSGPIAVAHDGMPNDFVHDFNTTAQNLGLPWQTDLTCGTPAGLGPISHTSQEGVRSDAYRGYLIGKDKPNLTIISGASVGRVILSSGSTPRATGVEFRDMHSQTYTVNARREVLMALGTVKTPIILQQSGIGPTDVLRSAGVTQRVNLPIGQNLIDQVATTTKFDIIEDYGNGQPLTFPRFQDLFSGEDAATMRGMLENNLEAYVQDAISNGAASSAAGLRTVLELQRDWILNKGASMSENYDYFGGTSLGYDSWYLLPFGRGSIKITNSDPWSEGFSIDPRFYSNEFDSLATGATARFTRVISTASPFSNRVTSETAPGTGTVGGNGLNEWAEWTKSIYRSNWHPIGTVPMMSKDLGGCVDSRHCVYGVDGLRVVDGSNLPFQVSSHLMSVLYGLAERAAELIQADAAGSNSTTSTGPTSAGPTPTSTSPPTTSTSPIGRAIHPNGDTTKCLEVAGGNFVDGAPVVINHCNGLPQQQWDIKEGYMTSLQVAGHNLCFDATQPFPPSGTKMKVWTCYPGILPQVWEYRDNKIMLQAQDQCLDLTDGNKANGNVMQLWECFPGNTNQIWTI